MIQIAPKDLMARGKILIGYNSPDVARDIQSLLKKEGYQVSRASDGVDVVRRAHLDPPDLILLDPTVRKMNGRQVCRLLKHDEHTRHVPILLLVADEEDVDDYWYTQAGADAYVAREHVLDYLRSVLAGLGRAQASAAIVRPASGHGLHTVDVLARVNTLLDKKLYEATILNEINNLAQSIADYEETAHSVLDILTKLVDYEIACFLVSGESSSHLILNSHVALSEEHVSLIAQRLARSFSVHFGRPLDMENVVVRIYRCEDQDSRDPVDEEYVARPALVTPVGMKDRLGGLLALWTPGRRPLDEDDLRTMSTVASTAYLVVDNARLYDEIKRMAITDDLTGLYNRRYFDEQLEREFHRSQRSGLSFSLLWADLDHFKLINDSYGHLHGDRLLRCVADAFRESTRPYDTVARLGGEEFAVILPETTPEEATEAGERLRRIAPKAAAQCGVEGLTLSVGVASYPHATVSTTSELCRLADEALYRAKRGGRDRVCL